MDDMFGTTSKLTVPGAGVAYMGASKENIDFTAKQLDAQAISWDKMNMLRHVRYFKNADGVRALMKKQAAMLKPKFDAVLNTLEEELAGRNAGEWVKPKGGYFVTFMANKGCAKRIVALCKEAGVTLTGAGATHPYKKDPNDSYVRIAPSFPNPEELTLAMQIFCVVAKLETGESFWEKSYFTKWKKISCL